MSIELAKLFPEALYDFWLTLSPRNEGQRRASVSILSLRPQAELVTGKLHVRCLLSTLPGSRPRLLHGGPTALSYDFSYDGAPFKTGDVIAFSG